MALVYKTKPDLKFPHIFSSIVCDLKSVAATSSDKEDCEIERVGRIIPQMQLFYPADSKHIQVVRPYNIKNASQMEIVKWELI